MLLVHKIKLKPNNIQSTYFKKSCGVARFAYNWALEEWGKQYKAGKRPSEISLRKELNAIKPNLYPWMLEATKVAPQQAIKNLGQAFKRFFQKQSKYPKFKKKGINDSFRADNGPAKAGADAVTIKAKKIKLPKVGWIKLSEKLRFVGQIKSVVVSRCANKWYAAISVDTNELPHVRKNHGIVGVDLGISHLATMSDGTEVKGPKAHKSLLSRLKRLSRRLSKKKKGSNSYMKARQRLSCLHARVSNIRKDAIHKLTTSLVLDNIKIGIEDLNVSGMQKNHCLARSVMDQGFYEFRRQLTYKADWYGTEVFIADRWYPSTKLCNVCKTKNTELTLKDRFWQCQVCNTEHHRDINAAINLEALCKSTEQNEVNTVSSTEI